MIINLLCFLLQDKCEKELGECTVKAGNEACGRLTCAVAFGRCAKKGMPSDPSYTPPPDMVSSHIKTGEGRVLNKAIYGDAPPQGSVCLYYIPLLPSVMLTVKHHIPETSCNGRKGRNRSVFEKNPSDFFISNTFLLKKFL